MEISKCPRCDLNYIKAGEEYCRVCCRELKKEISDKFSVEDIDTCIECAEHPALPGSDFCGACLLEKKLHDAKSKKKASSIDIEDGEIEGDDLPDKDEMDGFIIADLDDEFFDLESEEDDEDEETMDFDNTEKAMVL